MALHGEAKKEYQKKLMRRRRAEKRGLEVVVVNPVPMHTEIRAEAVWDSEKYPNKEAFKIAVARAERAKRYAEKFPHLIRGDDVRYQDVEWQYVNEGLAATKKRETAT